MQPFIDGLTFSILIAEIKQANPLLLLIKELNRSACDLFGYEQHDLVNQPLNVILSPNCPAELWQNAMRQLDSDHPAANFQAELINREKQIFPVMISLGKLTEPAKNETPTIAVLIQDLSASKQQEKKLLLMHAAVEQSASAVVITDPSGRIEYINPKFCSMTGYSHEELLGHNPRILQSGGTSDEQYLTMWQELLKQGEWRGEIKNQRKNGDDYWAFESISAIKNVRGEITHLLAVEEDITERKQVEAALQESEQRFRQMAEMTGEWLWEQDPGGYYIYCSTAVKIILGYQPEEIIGKHYTELLTLQYKTEFQSHPSAQNAFYALTNHYRHKEGRLVIAESTGLPIIDANGKLLKWRGVDRDITERKHYEDALIESEKRTRLIIETTLNAIIIMDSYGIITDWNQRAEKMFGWTRQEAIGRNMADLIVPERFRKLVHQELSHFLTSGTSRVIDKLTEQIALRRNGTEFPVELSIAPLKIGNAYEFSGFVHDISSRKAAERQIREAQVDLAIAQNEMKIAQEIQTSLFPAKPIISPHFEVTGYCLPATQIGGDYFDYFYRDAQHLDMVIADVSGHAVGPALLMVAARSAIRTQATWLGSPAQTLNVLNNFLYEDLYNADHFITLFYLQYSTVTQTLSYANAGHPPPLLYQKCNFSCKELDADGLIIGIRQNINFEEKKITLFPGDGLLIYTDGLTESQNPDGEQFGLNRLKALFEKYADQKPGFIVDTIIQHLKDFCQSDIFSDDITVMVFKRA
jgi:phosphoserine phosphatase RsbU/P